MTIHRFWSVRNGCTLVALVAALGVSVARGATSTFVQQASTAPWNTAASWADGDLTSVPTTGGGHIPNAAGDVAVLQQRVTNNASMGGSTTYGITLGGGTITIGALTVRNDNNEYTTALQTGTLVFDNGASPATFTEGLGTGTGSTSRTRLNLPVQLNSNLIVEQDHNLARNTATEFVQQVIADATKTLTKTGMGSLQFAYGGASDGFLGNVDIQQGDIRLINGSGTANTVFNQASGILVENGTQFQLGNGITSFHIAPGAEVKINGLANANTASTFNDGALRFEESAGNNDVVTFDSPVRMQTTSKIYVTAVDTTAVLTQELRGDGTAGLVKGGAGVLRLSTTSVNGNPYAGTTVVSNGALAVDNTISTASGVGSGNVNATNGGVLGGTGFIGTSAAPSNVSLTSSILSPGELTGTTAAGNLVTAPGVLTIRGNLTFDAASAFNVDITGATAGTQYDQVSEHGTVTLAGAALNVALGAFSPTGSETFTLIDNAGSQPISGVFGTINGVAGDYSEGASVTLGSSTFHITYDGGATHNDVMLIGGSVPTGVPGDFNGNGVVDMADYVLWRSGGPLQNEISDPGVVTAQDYLDWRAHFGNTSGSGSGRALGSSSAVPEPTSALLALVGVAALLVKPRKR